MQNKFFQAHNYIICMSISFDETENSHFPFSGSVILLHVNVDGLRVTCNHILVCTITLCVSMGENGQAQMRKKQFAIVKEMSFCFLVSLLMS